MTGMFDADPTQLIETVAKKLAEGKIVNPPQWHTFVKTGAHCERPPEREDWWYVRAAAVLRSVAKLGPIGTSKLRVKYGGRKHRGYPPERFARGGGAIIRKVLQQLERAGYIKHVEKGVHKGRILTPKGVSLLDTSAREVQK